MNSYSVADRTTRLPSGRYYIGDPCYVILDEEWSQALDETNYFSLFPSRKASENHEYNPKDLMNGVFKCTTVKDASYLFAVSSTEYGDGCYPCIEDGYHLGECGVDAGCIAAIPVEMIEKYGNEDGLELGVIHEFLAPFNVRYRDGDIKFGDVVVQTGE